MQTTVTEKRYDTRSGCLSGLSVTFIATLKTAQWLKVELFTWADATFITAAAIKQGVACSAP
jgi:hypothetical protein